MNVYCYRLQMAPGSRFGTPLLADSLFGALCWEVANRQGQSDLLKMLDRFRKGDPLPRPLVLSAPAPRLSGTKYAWVSHEEFMAIREGRTGLQPHEHPESLS